VVTVATPDTIRPSVSVVPVTFTPYAAVANLYPLAPPLPISCPSSTIPVLALKIPLSYVVPLLFPDPAI